jgi:uncharacterized protein
MTTRPPKFFALKDSECRALLRRHHVGRLAFTFKDHADIEPISYSSNGRWLYARTTVGTKFVQMKHNPWVAFQVDEIVGPFDWRSVVVRGTAYFLNPGGIEHPDFARALEMLRRIDPRILTEDDLAPDRVIVFCIHFDEVVGRAAVIVFCIHFDEVVGRAATTSAVRRAAVRPRRAVRARL